MKRGKQKTNTNPDHTKYKIFFLGIIAVVAVSILVVLFTNVQRSSSEQAWYGAATTTGCTDSDAGSNDYKTYGAVNYNGVVTSDVCQSSSKVTERYCKDGALASNNKPCSAPDTCYSKTVSLFGQQAASARCATLCQDQDQDGFQGSDYNGGLCELTTLADCKDRVVNINPGKTEWCDTIDNNCDGIVDEGCDDDNDNYCDSAMAITGTPSTCTATGADCQDTDQMVNPGAVDICGNGIDEDCTGTDTICPTYCVDADGDTYQDPANSDSTDPTNPSGCMLTTAADCNDGSAMINPGATELCDTMDNNCDGIINEGFDFSSDSQHCGSCGTICSSGDTCVNSVCTNIPLDFVSYWNFEEGSGTIATDYSGPNEAQIPAPMADPQWVIGKRGYGLDFDGDDYTAIGSDPSLNICAGDLTIMFWAKWTETTGNARDIIQLGKNSIKCAVSTGYNSYGQDKVAFGNTHTITGYPTWRYNAGTGLNDGNWHHIAVTKSGTDTVTIYVDGTTRPYYADGLRYYTNYNYIGKGFYGNFKGSLDEILIYDRALSAEEVAAMLTRTSQ